jgi:hypothetical protein
VFTARYGLIRYIKQITFRLQKIKKVSISVLSVCLISAAVFITVMESVYSAVRTDSFYKADYVSSSKG